jgi:multiple sugar transport system ATP-binding protein
MAKVLLENIEKSYADTHVVKNINLEIQDKEFLVLVGPSGCGKSTCLRMIAGLEEITAGNIKIGDRVVNHLSPKDRDIAMVFQSYALYPHMTVYANMAFGLRLKNRRRGLGRWMHRGEIKQTESAIREKVLSAAAMLDIQHLLDRKPRQLSGGQCQRVALGRAIVREPQVFLMDEPLSNLDAKMRVQTRAEIIKLHRRLGITTIYVTHDQVEAMTMGDRIAVMNNGILQQCDTPLNLYHHPKNRFVAGFIGSPGMNFLEMEVIKNGDDYYFENKSLRLQAPARLQKVLLPHAGKVLLLGIRPQDIYDRAHLPASIIAQNGNTVKACCEVTEQMGDATHLFLRAGDHSLIAAVTPQSQPHPEEMMELVFDLEKIHLFDVESGEVI